MLFYAKDLTAVFVSARLTMALFSGIGVVYHADRELQSWICTLVVGEQVQASLCLSRYDVETSLIYVVLQDHGRQHPTQSPPSRRTLSKEDLVNFNFHWQNGRKRSVAYIPFTLKNWEKSSGSKKILRFTWMQVEVVNVKALNLASELINDSETTPWLLTVGLLLSLANVA